MLTGSTRFHPESPPPSLGGFLPGGLAGLGPFFSLVLWVWAANPVLSPPPVFPQPFESLANSLGAHLVGSQSLLETDLGRQFQGPQASGFMEGSRTLMQQVPQGLQTAIVQEGAQALGPVGLLLQAGQSLLVEGVDYVAHPLRCPAYTGSDLGWGLPLAAGQDNLAPAQNEAVGGAYTPLELVLVL